MIIRSTHKFGPGIAETSITAKWVASIGASGTADIAPLAKEQEDDDGARSAEQQRLCAAGTTGGAERGLGASDFGFLSGVVEFLEDLGLGEVFDTVVEVIGDAFDGPEEGSSASP